MAGTGPCPVPCLELRLLADAQDQRVLRRIQVQAYDVADLLDVLVGNRPRAARPLLVAQPVQSPSQEPGPPLARRSPRYSQLGGHLRDGITGGEAGHDGAALLRMIPLTCLSISCDLYVLRMLVCGIDFLPGNAGVNADRPSVTVSVIRVLMQPYSDVPEGADAFISCVVYVEGAFGVGVAWSAA